MRQLVVFLVFILQQIWITGQQLSYDSFMDHLNGLEIESDYSGALEYLLSYESAFPEQWFTLSKEQIYLNEKMQRYVDNLNVLKEGHQRGFFYFLHTAIPRYKPYLEYPEFGELLETDRQLYSKALEKSSTIYQVVLPTGFNPDFDYRLFIIFHGGNSNFQKVRNHWNDDLLNTRFIKVYLQSYRHFDSESFTWRSGDPRSDGDIMRIYREILNIYPVDTTSIVLGGMSAGASYAIGMALRGVIPVTGFIAFCPGLPQEMSSDTAMSKLRTVIRGYMLGGENDYYQEQQERLCEIFDQIGLECLYVREEGMSHQYPKNESKYIREGLHFIMKD